MCVAERGWSDVDAGMIESLEFDEFEQLCEDIVRLEADTRHNGALVDGPARGVGVTDGGRDVLLTVRHRPKINHDAFVERFQCVPLTRDELVQTAFSCKTGKNWLKLCLQDIKNKKRESRSVEVLREGGFFQLWIATTRSPLDKPIQDPTSKKGSLKPREHIIRAFAGRMQCAVDDIADRIDIVTPDRVAAWLRSRRPTNFDRWLGKFELSPVLHSTRDWWQQHENDRKRPEPFQLDETRRAIQRQLLAWFGGDASTTRAAERVAWLVGAPGVGKTRLVLDSLEQHDEARAAVRVATSAREALDNLSKIFERHSDLLLVVDDCGADDIDELTRSFEFWVRKLGYPRARLLILSPASPEGTERSPRVGQRWDLPALTQRATQSLVDVLVGGSVSPDDVSRIVEFSEGYPWFAALLAQEAQDVGRAPTSLSTAVNWALASEKEFPDPSTRAKEQRTRRAALIAVSASLGVEWSLLTPARQDELARAVDLDWQSLHAVAEECHRRGLIRRRGEFQYVTPRVLERAILTEHFGPRGPDRGGRRFRERAPTFTEGLDQAFTRAGVAPETARAVAESVLEELDWSGPFDRWAARLSPTPLLSAARVNPEGVASLLRARISNASSEELRESTRGRRALVWALELLADRKRTFEDAEEALFRLAVAENESYANNATGVWLGLFSVELNTTHRSLDQRLALLSRRLDDSTAQERALVIRALVHVIELEHMRRVGERQDGDPMPATLEEARTARSRAWALLARATSLDDVGTDARSAMIANLRGMCRVGLAQAAADTLLGALDRFDDQERAQLRSALDEIRRSEGPEVSNELRPLARQVAPMDLRAKLLDRVAGHRFGEDEDEWLDADRGVARELLVAEDRERLFELALDESHPRSVAFAFALGREDSEWHARTWMLGREADLHGARILAAYLSGQREEQRGVEVERVLDHLAEQGDVRRLALCLASLDVTDGRLDRLTALTSERPLEDELVLYLRFGQWLKGVSVPSLKPFLRSVLVPERPIPTSFVLRQCALRLEADPSAMVELRELLIHALELGATLQLDSLGALSWRDGCQRILKDDLSFVVGLAYQSASRPRAAGEHAWEILAKASREDAEATWNTLSARLARRDSDAERFVSRAPYRGRAIALPVDSCLDWTGHDLWRASALVAMTSPRTSEVPPILRELLVRFGPDGPLARAIERSVFSTERAVSSIAQFKRAQAESIRGWMSDSAPQVRDFAERLIARLDAGVAHEEALEEVEKLRWA